MDGRTEGLDGRTDGQTDRHRERERQTEIDGWERVKFLFPCNTARHLTCITFDSLKHIPRTFVMQRQCLMT